jgi:hypothetical protein
MNQHSQGHNRDRDLNKAEKGQMHNPEQDKRGSQEYKEQKKE